MTRLPPSPRLDWTEHGAPRAAAFDDVYFSREGGLAETEAVFLKGCGLPDAWRNQRHFSICELGFGAGLNVLAAWRAWKLTRFPHAILHICSIEAFPLDRTDAERALSCFPEISSLAKQLLARWPVRACTPQRLWFAEDGVALTLFTGDAAKILSEVDAGFDAWFLDGFAPAKNPAMWSADVLRQVGRLSNPGARLATFTVAGEVRRGLQAAGFDVAKAPGYGSKRQRLEARFTATPEQRRSMYPGGSSAAGRVAVVGAGIAGAACAHAFARRGVETIVLETAAPAAGASGNPAGLVMPRLDRGGVLSGFHLSAYLHAVSEYERLGAGVFDPCGVEIRPVRDDRAALADLLADPPLPADWFAAAPGDGAFHPRAGLVRPRAAIDGMLAHAKLFPGVHVGSIERQGDTWSIRSDDGREIVSAGCVVLASGASLSSFPATSFIPMALSLGQIEWGRATSPERALVRGNYLAPYDGGVLFGATFDPYAGQHADSAYAEDARRRNLDALGALAPEIAASLDAGSLQSRASVRATTPDRAPIAGLLPDAEAWLARYAGVARGQRPDLSVPPPALDGFYALGGLGARGLTLAPLLGERIASEICGEPQPLLRRELEALHPARFLYRALKRG